MGRIESFDQSLRGAIRHFSKTAVPAASKVMGLMLLMYGMMCIYIIFMGNTEDYVFEANWTRFCGTAIVVVCSFLILADFSFNLNRTVGLYAIAIGGNRFFKYINYAFTTGTSPYDIAMFVFGLVMAVTSLNLCFTGTVFLRGMTRSRVSMVLTSMFMLVMNAVIIVLMAQEMPGSTFYKIIELRPDLMAMMVLYLMLICMLGTEKIRYSSMDEHYISVLNGIRRTNATSSDAFISRLAAIELSRSFTDRSNWKKIDDGGPVEEEFDFSISNRWDDKTYVRVQKWKGKDELFFTMSDHEGGSLVNAYRFAATEIIPDGSAMNCRYLHIYGKDLHLQIQVKDFQVKKKWGVDYGI